MLNQIQDNGKDGPCSLRYLEEAEALLSILPNRRADEAPSEEYHGEPTSYWANSEMATELKPYGIKYELRMPIKRQVLADFITEFTLARSDLLEGWMLNADGASNNKGSEIRITITTLEGSIIE